jgi:hypothetical protein
MVMDKLDCAGAMQEALFTVHCEAYPRCKLGRFKSFITLKMEAICFSETLALTTDTWCNISKDIHHYVINHFTMLSVSSLNICRTKSEDDCCPNGSTILGFSFGGRD